MAVICSHLHDSGHEPCHKVAGALGLYCWQLACLLSSSPSCPGMAGMLDRLACCVEPLVMPFRKGGVYPPLRLDSRIHRRLKGCQQPYKTENKPLVNQVGRIGFHQGFLIKAKYNQLYIKYHLHMERETRRDRMKKEVESYSSYIFGRDSLCGAP